jgi:geranylgeranylglycerol-phosphate geranylgeranyltransferase
MRNHGIYWEFARPFTLLMPAIGVLAGGIVAWGAAPRAVSNWTASDAHILLNLAAGALMAALMNAGSNGLNQIYDLEIDRINKPERPLPSGRLGLREAWWFTAVTMAAGLVLAWFVNWQCFTLAVTAALLTACYSAPPARTKRWGIPANITVSIPRGFLLPVAGWSTVKTVATLEPWLLALPLGLFIFGASSTKDFSDIPGDRAGGCQTLPVKYGVRKTALIIAPFFVFPFALWALFASLGYFSAPRQGIYALSAALPIMGFYIDVRILARPEELSSGENHISWKLIYLMAIFAYAGLALIYAWPRSA